MSACLRRQAHDNTTPFKFNHTAPHNVDLERTIRSWSDWFLPPRHPFAAFMRGFKDFTKANRGPIVFVSGPELCMVGYLHVLC